MRQQMATVHSACVHDRGDRMPNEMNAPENATSRLRALWGNAPLARIEASCVMVFGAGGVGSNCIEALARGGVQTIIVVDGDEVVESNINRQAIAFFDSVGMCKVDAVRALIERINPCARVVARDTFVLPRDVEPLILDCMHAAGGQIDYIIDAIDTVSTKLELADTAERLGIPLVSSMGGAMKLYPERLRFADIYETSGDALARVMRKGCRKRGVRHLDVLYSTEAPIAVPAEQESGSTPHACHSAGGGPEEPSEARAGCRDLGDERAQLPPLGTTSYLPPIMGQMLAGFVLRRLAGIEPATPLGSRGKRPAQGGGAR